MSNSEGESGSGLDLATIERVDIRGVWSNEAADFTPWLAENIGVLGEALGMDLELDAQEASVGSYALDILARDQDNRQVVIENQLEATDHTHLGQLLTYAAGFDANVIVWIARNFRDEHREALDLLNRRTGEDTAFFGIEVELWRIDDSRPAVNFNLIATPNEWSNQTVSDALTPGNVTPRMERYREFFQELIDTLREDHNFTNARRAGHRRWCRFSAGYGRRARYGANFAAEERARVELYIASGDTDWNSELFDQLSEHEADIQSELGESLEWDRLGNPRIAVVRPGSIDDDEETLAEIRGWMVERLLKFEQVFEPRLDELVV